MILLDNIDYSSGIISKSPELIEGLIKIMDKGVSIPGTLNERVDKEIEDTLKKLPVNIWPGLPSFLKSMAYIAIDYGRMSANDSFYKIQDPIDYEEINRKTTETVLIDSKLSDDQKLFIIQLAQFAFIASIYNTQSELENGINLSEMIN